MTHVALVGARIDDFLPLGFKTRTELSMHRVFPETGATTLAELPADRLQALLASQLPLWIHNVVTDHDFPQRARLAMALRRFEGEMRDNRDDEVVAAVLSAGFRNRQLNPMELPDSMPMRQRCSMLMQIDTWQEAYKSLESELTSILAECAGEVDQWMATSEPEISHAVAL